MKRRQFSKIVPSALLGSTFLANQATFGRKKKTIKPKRLQKGDTIGFISYDDESNATITEYGFEQVKKKKSK